MNNEKINVISGAIDEQELDERDYILGADYLVEYNMLPDTFTIEDGRYQNQDIEGLKVSCTAQSVTNASNNSLWIKWDRYREFEGKNLWEKMEELGLTMSNGAALIDAVKIGKDMGIVNEYYQTSTLLEILNAIYKGDCVVSGSSKINWNDCRADGLVREARIGAGHAFCICGWDKNKKIGEYVGALRCENSYGKDYQDNGGFWIPFDLINLVLFNTRKAIKVSPLWGALSQDERLKIREDYINRKEGKI